MKSYSHLTKAEIDAVRRLDVAWAHKQMTSLRGYPFLPGKSIYTGREMTADEVALVALHQLRLELGTKKQSKASLAWLKERGLRRAFGEPLEAN